MASHAANDPAAHQAPLRSGPVRGGGGGSQQRGAGAARVSENQTGPRSEERRTERVRRPLHPGAAAHTHRTGKMHRLNQKETASESC